MRIQSVNLIEPSPESNELIDNNQKSAKEAIKILEKKDNVKYVNLTGIQKKNLITAFASKDRIVYGKAFDIIRIEGNVSINFDDSGDIVKNINSIIVCEIKSTRRNTKKMNFEGHFFGLTTAELLVAQNLKDKYKFVFVNIHTKEIMELSLKQVFEKAKGIYPQWSVSF